MRLRVARAAVREVERKMLTSISPKNQNRLRNDLTKCIEALGDTQPLSD
jgi:hypothetical protein